MICTVCQGDTQPTFEGPQEHCRKCGTLHWIKDGVIHQSVRPFYWDDYEIDSEIFRIIRDTLEAVGCLHGKRCGESTPPMMYNDWIRCAIAKREQQIRKLRSQLPEEMQDCTILVKQCELGHGWLTAANWVQHGCPTCTINCLKAIIETNNICHNLHGQVDAAAFAEGCAEEQRKLYGRAPDADLAEKLLADNRRLKDRLAAMEQELDESYDF